MDLDFSKVIEDTCKDLPAYQRIAEGITSLILKGVLSRGDRLPPINNLAKALDVNRLTVMRALDGMEMEGWLVKKERSGVFVSSELPVCHPDNFAERVSGQKESISIKEVTISGFQGGFSPYSFNDGFPDHRLFPVDEMGRAYSTVLKDKICRELFWYGDFYGYLPLRESLVAYLHRTRALSCQSSQIMVTRGSTMGIMLAAKAICAPGDTIAMGWPGYYMAKECFENMNLKVLRVPTDESGLDTSALKGLLKSHPVRMVFVTPHHDYPTTVTMPAERRLELMNLAAEYNFFILEDDYDFDFQYEKNPIMPIASLDKSGRVIYVGGFSKSLSPSLRIGFLVGHQKLIENMGRIRKLIDRMGDTIQEAAFERLLSRGSVERVTRKARKVYRQRRDHLYQLLTNELGDALEVKVPDGGLVFWAKFKKEIHPEDLMRACREKGLIITDPARYKDCSDGYPTRLGFASMNEKEAEAAVGILKSVLN